MQDPNSEIWKQAPLSYDDWKTLDKDLRRDLLAHWRLNYNDKELREGWHLTYAKFYSLLKELGLATSGNSGYTRKKQPEPPEEPAFELPKMSSKANNKVIDVEYMVVPEAPQTLASTPVPPASRRILVEHQLQGDIKALRQKLNGLLDFLEDTGTLYAELRISTDN